MSSDGGAARPRMTGQERREQLIEVGKRLFASNGFAATTVEEIAAAARVSKPVVYEHFGGKEGLYAVVVDRAVKDLLGVITEALTGSNHPHETLERAAVAYLDFIDRSPYDFRILVRGSVPGEEGAYASLINAVAERVEHLLADEFKQRRLDPKLAPLYAQMLTGQVAVAGQWWLDSRRPRKEVVAKHVVALAWAGLRGMER